MAFRNFRVRVTDALLPPTQMDTIATLTHGIPTNSGRLEPMTNLQPGTVDEYIDSFGAAERSRLAELRELITAAAPAAVESLKWRTPAFSHPEGVILVMLSGHKSHTNVVFTPSTKDAFAADLQGIATGKGSVKIPYTDPIPESLVRRMVQHRVREYEERGVLWM